MSASALVSEDGKWRFAGATTAQYADEVTAAGETPATYGDRAARRAAFERLTVAVHPWRDLVAGGSPIRIEAVSAREPRPAQFLSRLDDATPPAAAFAVAPGYDAYDFCSTRCFGKRVAVGPNGEEFYAVIAVGYDGRASIAMFDEAAGAYVARGTGRAGDYDDGEAIVDPKTRDAHRESEYRRIAETLTAAPPLLGDLVVDGVRLSFAYQDDPGFIEPAYSR